MTHQLSKLKRPIISPHNYIFSHLKPDIRSMAVCSMFLSQTSSHDISKPQHSITLSVVHYSELPTETLKCSPNGFTDKKKSKHGCIDMFVPTASSLSELSSLHEGGTSDFRHTYQTVQMKALPPIEDLDDQSVLRAAAATQGRRSRLARGNHSDDELDRR